MATIASLFSNENEAEMAASELNEAEFADGLRTQIVSQADWEDIWQDSDESGQEPETVESTDFDEYLDIWLDEDTIRLFGEGLKQGGAVLVVDVPDPFAVEAQKIMQKNNGKIG
jgi:hypothetical protein